MVKKRRYPLNIDPDLFDRFKEYAKQEYKLVNVKIVELINNYVKKSKAIKKQLKKEGSV